MLAIKLAIIVPKVTLLLINNGIKTILPPQPGSAPSNAPNNGCIFLFLLIIFTKLPLVL